MNDRDTCIFHFGVGPPESNFRLSRSSPKIHWFHMRSTSDIDMESSWRIQLTHAEKHLQKEIMTPPQTASSPSKDDSKLAPLHSNIMGNLTIQQSTSHRFTHFWGAKVLESANSLAASAQVFVEVKSIGSNQIQISLNQMRVCKYVITYLLIYYIYIYIYIFTYV